MKDDGLLEMKVPERADSASPRTWLETLAFFLQKSSVFLLLSTPPQCSPLNELVLMQSSCLNPSVVASNVDVVYMCLLNKNSTEEPVGVA